MRFAIKYDFDRYHAGWGHHYWILDQNKTGDDQLMRLYPDKDEAVREFERFNRRNDSIIARVLQSLGIDYALIGLDRERR
jgi:hypothetical protein